LERRKARGVKLPLTNVGDLARLPLIPTAIVGSHHSVEHCAPLLPVDPQEELGLRSPFFHIEMVAMQGHTAIAVGGAGKERVGEFLREPIWGIRPALRCAQDLDRNGREPLIFE
jgi:hypothetical protein